MSDLTSSKDATLSVGEQLQAELKSIRDQYAALQQTTEPSNGEAKTTLDKLLQRVRDVQTSFQASAVTIPSRDQRTLSEAISSLSNTLATTRTAAQPRTKFAFKKKSSSATTSLQPSPSSASPVPATPSLQPSTPLSEEPVPVFPELDPRPIRRLQSSAPLTIRHQSGEDIRPVTATGASTVSHLASSVLLLPEGQAGLHLSHCSSSLLILGAVDGAVHLTSLTNCTVVVAARQVRLHKSSNVAVYLSCSSEPILEDSTGIRVATLPSVFSWHHADDKWDQWRDFNHVPEGSPNWSLLPSLDTVNDSTWREVLDETIPLKGTLQKLQIA